MRILFISQWCTPEPIFKSVPFASELKRRGHDVTILTGFPNYPQGKLYPGYRLRPYQRETIDGVSIVRAPLYPDHSGSSIKRIINYTSFAFSASILGPLLLKKPDIIYVYHPPATVFLPAIVLKALWGVPIVCDIQDLWPDTLYATNMVKGNFVYRAVDRWCRYIYRKSDHIVVLSEGFKRRLVERGVDGGKIDVIYNWCDEDNAGADRSLEPDIENALRGRFNVLFAGTMGKAQALKPALEAAEKLMSAEPDIQFVFIGGGIEVDSLKRIKEDRRLSNVIFLPPRPMNRMSPVYDKADVLLVHLRKDPLFEITVPSKVQAYMHAGKPIIIGCGGDAADLVRKAGAGIECEPENPESIARAVIEMRGRGAGQLSAMGQSARDYYFANLSLEIGASRFEDTFDSLLCAK